MIYSDDKPESPVVVTLIEPGEDVELKAMAYIWSIVVELTDVQRDRVIWWIGARNAAAKNELQKVASR